MFGFFNKKNKLLLPPDNFLLNTDMHSHILPGIDDGAPDLESALQLINGLYALGFRTCIATPHIIGDLYRNNAVTIMAALDMVKTACLERGIKMELSAAAEYMLDDYFMQLIQQKQPLLTLHKNLILTEFSYTNEPNNIKDILFAILTEGYQPILAHPERYFYFHRNYDAFYQLKELGFHLQVNLLSLTGYYGKEVSKAAHFIIDKDLASLLATDLHHQKHVQALTVANGKRLFQDVLKDKEWNNLDSLVV